MHAIDPDQARLRASVLSGFEILDTEGEQAFDDIVGLAAKVCDAPVAVISLVDRQRQWFKAEVGLGQSETPISQSICVHALADGEYLEVNDTHADPRFADNPLCDGEGGFRFYAGRVLISSDGVPYGTLCVLDRQPRQLSETGRFALTVLAHRVEKELELRRMLRNERRMAQEIDHRVKNSLQVVSTMLRLQAKQAAPDGALAAALDQAGRRVASIGAVHGELNATGAVEEIELKAFLGRIGMLVGETLPDNVTLELDVEPARLPSQRAAAAGLFLNEFVTNAAQHAFPPEGPGRVRVTGRVGDGGYTLTFADDGVGMPEGSTPGLGLGIMEAAASELDATLARPATERGTAVVLTFPV